MSRSRTRTSIGAWGAIIATCLVIVGCGGGADRETVDSDRAPGVGDCAALAGSIEQIECYVDRATAAGHPKICQEVVRENVRYQCLAILAGRLKDASLCDDIPTSGEETRALRDSCLSDVAKVLAESALCDRILAEDVRDRCNLEISRASAPRPTDS